MTTTTTLRVRLSLSTHALKRWCERVDPGATQIEARMALGQLVSRGRVRPTPRHWTDADPAPGLTFIYWSQRPHVCALVVDGVVVTVLTRELCRSTSPRATAALSAIGAARSDLPRRLKPVPAWHWDGRWDAA